jgi:7-carboxy-7-deazaguanine synthase
MLQLIEIFASIQGESTFAGLPCIFIRLAGCNLRCKYCDSTYSYQPQFLLEIDEILSNIAQYNPIKLVEITGGEPLLQRGVYELIEKLHGKEHEILLETNGSQNVRKIPNYVYKIMDVKCPGSGSENSFLLENLDFLSIETDEIKFVLSNEQDYKWAKDFINKHHLEKHKILFSTVFSELSPALVAEWIVKDRLPYRLQLQLHKYIWHPEQRGV